MRPTCSFFPAFLIALIGFPAFSVAQEARPRRIAHTIEVTRQGGTCYYQIHNQTPQDTLRVASGGRLLLIATPGADELTGFAMSVEIQMAPGDIDGTSDRQRTRFISANRPQAQIPVRGRGAGRSVHEVVIRCCDGNRPRDCAAAPRAKPHPDQTGARSIPADAREIGSGPHFTFDPLTPRPLAATGGPVMKVED